MRGGLGSIRGSGSVRSGLTESRFFFNSWVGLGSMTAVNCTGWKPFDSDNLSNATDLCSTIEINKLMY